MKNHNRIKALSWIRIFFGLLILAAFVTQITYSVARGGNIANFFSFFTIQSNLLAAFILLVVGIGTLVRAKANPQFALLRGGATLYMTMTGIIFALLLSGLEQRLQVTIPWVNTVFHYLIPIVMLVDWLLFPPKFKFTFRHAVLWLLYPIAYLVYSLIRGAFVGWYPYPFLDPPQVGWVSVIVTSIVIAIGTTALAWLLTLRTGHRSKW